MVTHKVLVFYVMEILNIFCLRMVHLQILALVKLRLIALNLITMGKKVSKIKLKPILIVLNVLIKQKQLIV